MAEIILEPTELSKVIPISLKINDTDAKAVTRFATKRQFNTSDTDAWLSFNLEDVATTSGVYDLTMVNVDEDPSSVVHHTDIAFSAIPFHYKLDSGEDLSTNEIRHAGRWIGQIVVRMANGDTTSRQFDFAITGHLLDGNEARLILIEDYNSLIATITASKTELEGYNVDYSALLTDINAAEALRVQAELDRAATFDALVESEMVAQNVAIKLTEKEATFAPRILSVEQQLEQTLNKSAITLSHMFADATARDAYFVAHPTELMEQLFIKVGTGYQQYLLGVWSAASPIVAEQLSATNQPITDTGNYFATDNTNAALQEMGAHKASTSNPHGVTKAQVGLGNVDNTSDANKPISTAMQTALDLKANKAQEAWIDLTLINGWTGYVKIKKDDLGIVRLKASLTPGTVTYYTSITTAPTGYRPITQIRLIAGVTTGVGGVLAGEIRDGFYMHNGGALVLPPNSGIIAGMTVFFEKMYFTD